jgi:von Willebrand factor type A domain-containing protein
MKQTTHVAIVVDSSGSMQHLRRNVVDSLNQQLDTLKQKSAEFNQDTRVSLYTFSYQSDIKRHRFEDDPRSIREWTEQEYNPRGNTALVSAVRRAIGDLSKLPDAEDKNSAFLVITITDGQENDSYYDDKLFVPREMKRLNGTDRWTFVFAGPHGSRRELETFFGAFAGNVTEWETTTKGLSAYTGQTIGALSGYMATRSQGITMTKSFFQPDLSTVDSKQVRKSLDDLTHNFKRLPVKKECDIKPFVEEATKRPYAVGTAFYELTKKEKVQRQKDLLLLERSNNKIFGGPTRQFIGLPNDDLVVVDPGNHGDWRIFVQSTSTNRKLVRGTDLLVRI